MNKLCTFVNALSLERLHQFQSELINAGIRNEYKGNLRPVFKRLRKESTGQLKKLYAALYKSKPDEREQIFKIIAER